MILKVLLWAHRVCLIGSILLLSSCVFSGNEKKSGCHFEYSEDLKKEVITPFLIEKVGEDMVKFFNVDKPVITEKEDITRVILSAIKSVNGQMVMFENSYIFVFNTCERTLLESYEVVRN